jgi:large subunit ribosomal protein L1
MAGRYDHRKEHMAKQDLDQMLSQAQDTLDKGGDLSKIDNDQNGKVKETVSKKESINDKIKKSRMEANQADEAAEEVVDGATGKKAKKTKKGKAKTRSAKYTAALEQVDANKKYEITDALELVKKTSLTKFDGNVEVHIRMIGKNKKAEQVRGMIQYPNTTGKSLTVVILDEATIEEITKTGKADADIYLTTPADMGKVAKLARVLGPKGKMPNPKSGTITLDPAKTKAELEGGKTEFKSDSYGIVHQVIGKVSAKEEALAANFKALLAVLPVEKIVSINISATMGPSVKVQK